MQVWCHLLGFNHNFVPKTYLQPTHWFNCYPHCTVASWFLLLLPPCCCKKSKWLQLEQLEVTWGVTPLINNKYSKADQGVSYPGQEFIFELLFISRWQQTTPHHTTQPLTSSRDFTFYKIPARSRDFCKIPASRTIFSKSLVWEKSLKTFSQLLELGRT